MKQKGFTLIELIIVIAIIGILAAIAIPNYIGFQNRAKDSGVLESLGAYRTALAMYYADASGYPTELSAATVGKYLDIASTNKNFKLATEPVYSTSTTVGYIMQATANVGGTYTATSGGISPAQ